MNSKDKIVDERFEELCLDLNLDSETKEEALQEFERIKENYSLEGEPTHWLACALYEACRRQTVPTVGNGQMEGNGVSLTRLLRTAHLSLIQFFNKIKKWADMANLPEGFRQRVDRLERNFAVSTVIFKKYRPIFISVFKDPNCDPPKPQRSRKQRPKPCLPSDVYDFVWRIFVLAKGSFPNICDDLVNSYHLLLAVIDWAFCNAVLAKRDDLLKVSIEGLPANFARDGRYAQDSLCIIELLCSKHDGIEMEAKSIKEHHFKGFVTRLMDKGVLKGCRTESSLSGVLDINFFEDNVKAIDRAYEEYVLTIGDFDERIFLGKDADHEIGTPAKQSSSHHPLMDGPTLLLEAAARNNAQPLLQQHIENTRSLCPKTPLTGRQHLPAQDVNNTPVSMATQGVAKLHALFTGRKQDGLSEKLLEIFSECEVSPQKSIETRIASAGELFTKAYTMPCNQQQGSHADFAKIRLQTAVMLYYKVLENILVSEKKRLQIRAPGKSVDLSGLLEQDIFHRSLFACCLEVVIFSYNSQRTFPWIIAVFDIQPYDFYKVIELLIRAEEGLSRDIVKHLNSIEESILDCLAWKNDSPLWDYIRAMTEQNKSCLPTSEEVSLTSQQAGQQNTMNSPLNSPLTHPQIRRLAMSDGKLVVKKGDVSAVTISPTHSPSRPPLASDRFSSPVASTARRRLFPAGSSSAAPSSDGSSLTIRQHIITYQPAQTDDGQQILIPFQLVQNVPQNSSSGDPTVTQDGATVASSVSTCSVGTQKPEETASDPGTSSKQKRTGSLALFFRKVYHLCNVRLKDLCDRLNADDQLRRRVWTALEHCMVNEVDLMKDRHLDQFIMCAVYSICKVSGRDQSFQDIMRCYRLQPQAQSHVYRSVLLSHVTHANKTRESQRQGEASTQSSEDSNSSDKIQDRLNMLRSSSTLPLSQGEDSVPPTPTKASGQSTAVYEGEERGDLIKFYNSVYVKHMKKFILRFQQGTKMDGELTLSSIPKVRTLQTSPRRISNTHSLYISPHKKPQVSLLTPNSRLLYCFNSSPAKDLRAINNMLRMGERKALATTQSTAEKRGSSDMADAQAIKRIKFENSL